MASLESVDVGRLVEELARELDEARTRKRQAERMLERIAGMMRALGLKEACDGEARAQLGDDGGLHYTADFWGLKTLHDRLAAARYYHELLADLDELRPYLSYSALEKAELVKQHLDRLLESLKCKG
ncbi:MAG: hypothetical protein GSR84_04625 [Desulfurococcales archaeon]|nr:hypothetical protein [Desulfurococcales archaeon]